MPSAVSYRRPMAPTASNAAREEHWPGQEWSEGTAERKPGLEGCLDCRQVGRSNEGISDRKLWGSGKVWV